MKKSIYIGMCQEGSTSLMRYKSLVSILEKSHEIDLINIQPQIDSTKRIFRSIGWRYKVGPLIHKINSFISKSLLDTKDFDFVWIDKGVFIHPNVLRSLKVKTDKIIHFTPDPAFYYHKSTLFYKGLPLYTHVITTKSFEIELYKSRTDAELLFCTQGYDGLKHFPMVSFDDKKYDFSFIGHYEYNRAKIIKALLNNGRSITLAGPKWRIFYYLNRFNKNLNYLGPYLKGDAYTQAISNSFLSLGFLSKWIPEQHTTRTFEIPACGSLLVTERTEEICGFFAEDEVCFYSDLNDLILNIETLLMNHDVVRMMIEKSRIRLNQINRTHDKIVENLLVQIGII